MTVKEKVEKLILRKKKYIEKLIYKFKMFIKNANININFMIVLMTMMVGVLM